MLHHAPLHDYLELLGDELGDKKIQLFSKDGPFNILRDKGAPLRHDNLTQAMATAIAEAEIPFATDSATVLIRGNFNTFDLWNNAYRALNLTAQDPFYVIRDPGTCQGNKTGFPRMVVYSYHKFTTSTVQQHAIVNHPPSSTREGNRLFSNPGACCFV
jgi:hypothetical protein